MAKPTKPESTPKPPTPQASPSAETPAAKGFSPVERFDRSPYDPLPVLDLAEALALASALLSARPASVVASIEEEARRLAEARDHASAVLASHVSRPSPVNARPFDLAMDRAWATMVRRVQDQAELPPDRHATAARAGELYAILQDLTVLRLPYAAEYTQLAARLELVTSRGLLQDLRAFAGSEFVEEVLHCHREYGRVLGITHAAEETGTPGNRKEALLALRDALGEYVLQVLASARAGRPSSWSPVVSSLRPIVDLRERQAKRASSPVTDPLPPPTPPTPPSPPSG